MPQNNPDTEALTQAGLNLIQQALSIYDSDLRLAVANRPFKEMFDLPAELVTPGAHFSDTIRYLLERGEYGDLEDPDSFLQDRIDQAKAFEPHYVERTRANGRMISIEGSPLAQGGWVAVYTDITGIKRQEQLLHARSAELSGQVLAHSVQLAQTNRELAATNAALEEAKRQLTEMESRARMTAEMMPAHIARLAPNRCYTYSNRRLSSIIPGRPSNLLGLHAREALGDEVYGKIEPYLNRAFAGEASVFEVTHSSSGRRLRVAFTPDNEGAGISGVYILSTDVTEETQARAALTQTRKRELAAQLTSGMAHDFSNLLTIILGMQSSLSQMDLPEKARSLVDATTGAARRGGTFLDRIASISGHREIRPEPTNIAALVLETVTLATPTLPDGVSLVTEIDDLPGSVLLDPGALQDGLLNLILNAKDAIANNAGEIKLSARLIRETWLELKVSDTGPGFGEHALEHALDPFFTTKGGEGSGLGLAMVYDQTKLSGGHVRLANNETGAVVTLRLPLRLAGKPTTPRLILLIEDSPDIRTSVREMLTGMGHQVIEAASAEEAEGLVEIDGIGLILSDIMLEGRETGDAFLARMRQGGLLAPACLMTSLPPDDTRRANTGFSVIAKPFSSRQLAAFLAQELAT